MKLTAKDFETLSLPASFTRGGTTYWVERQNKTNGDRQGFFEICFRSPKGSEIWVSGESVARRSSLSRHTDYRSCHLTVWIVPPGEKRSRIIFEETDTSKIGLPELRKLVDAALNAIRAESKPHYAAEVASAKKAAADRSRDLRSKL